MSQSPRLPAVAATALVALSLLACRDRSAPATTTTSPTPAREAARARAPRAVQPSPPAAPLPKQADVLIITIDTLRGDALGYTGRPGMATPNLDRMAKQGIEFPRAHSQNVVTFPSHTNILTGLYPYQHGVRENTGFVLDPSVPTLAAMLKKAGYATGAFVSAYPLDSKNGLDHGFDVYDDEYPQEITVSMQGFAERPGNETVALARKWWDKQPGKRFMWVHLFDPHAPYAPPPDIRQRHPKDLYFGEVEVVDRYLGPLLKPFLDGRERPALVVVTADHGESLGDHGELTHGLFAYEPTLHVPLLVWYNGVRPAKDPRFAAHVDIAPTALQAAGLPIPATMQGRSLVVPDEPGRKLYFEALSTYFNRGWAPLRGLISDGDKMVALPIPEIYDLVDDPKETRNLVDQERRRYHALNGSLDGRGDWPPGQRHVMDEGTQQLRALGYLSASPSLRKTFGPQDDPKNLRDLDTMMHDTVAAYVNKDYDEVLRLGREMIRRRPMAVAYGQVVTVLRDRHQNAEAIALINEAIKNDAIDDVLMRQLGLAYAEVGNTAEAIKVLGPLAASGVDLESVNGLAVAVSDAGRQQEALALVDKVLKKAPRDPKAHETKGVALLRLNRPAEAQKALEQALSLNSRQSTSWNTLGVARAYQGDLAGAMDAWDRAIALDPLLFDALYNLGLTAAQVGDRARAKSALTRYVQTAPPARYGGEIAKARQILGQLG